MVIDTFTDLYFDQVIAWLTQETLPNVASILDIGCGRGRISAWLAEQFSQARVIAIDRDPHEIQLATSRYPFPNLHFQVDDAMKLKLKNSFDLVVSFFCFQYNEDQTRLLEKMYQALMPGGKLLVMISHGDLAMDKVVLRELSDESLTAAHERFSTMSSITLYEDHTYRRFLENVGFENTDVVTREVPILLATETEVLACVQRLVPKKTKPACIMNIVRTLPPCPGVPGGSIFRPHIQMIKAYRKRKP